MAVKRTGEMAVLNRKILTLTIAALMSSASLFAQEDMGSGKIIMKNFKLPQYNVKTNTPDFIIYGEEADMLGIVANIKGLLVDVFQKNVKDIRIVKNLEGSNVYDITWDSDKVKAFWKNLPHSLALIQSPSAEYDRSTQIIKGKEWIKVRTHFADLDGVGFELDQTRQTLHIDQKVKVVYREDLKEAEDLEKAEKEKKEIEKKDNLKENKDKIEKKQE